MRSDAHISAEHHGDESVNRDIVRDQANTDAVLTNRLDEEKMAKRRFQDPKPKREGNWWYLRIRQDVFAGGRKTRQLKRVKLAPDRCRTGKLRKLPLRC